MFKITESPWYYVIYWVRMFFAAHLIYSGGRYVLFQHVPELSGLTGSYIDAISSIGLYQGVKYFELITGLLILSNRWVPLALLLEMPITVMIFYLNVFISAMIDGSPLQYFTGPQELFLNGFLLVAYGGYYCNFLRFKARPYWLWNGYREPGLGGTHEGQEVTNNSGLLKQFIVIFILICIVVAGSTGLGVRSIRHYDTYPLLFSVLATIIAVFMLSKKKS